MSGERETPDTRTLFSRLSDLTLKSHLTYNFARKYLGLVASHLQVLVNSKLFD